MNNKISFEEITKNKEYRERLIKYFRLPMRLSVSEDKFNSDLKFIQATDPSRYKQLIEFTERDFNKLAREQGTLTPDFTMENILEPLIADFEASPRWQAFLEKDYSDVLADYGGITNTHGFYIKENDGKHLISIDLESANWQSLQSIIGFDESYEETIDRYTDNLIPPISKTFRTKITGLMGQKNITDYSKHLLKINRERITKVLYEETGIDLREKTPFAFYADEILLEVDKQDLNKFNKMNLVELENKVYNITGVRIHLRPFTLNWLDVDKVCVKFYKNNKYELLNISKDVAMIYKKLDKNIPLEDIDFENIKLKDLTREQYIKKIQKSLEQINLGGF